ncbi:MAG: sulfite reductase (ferredoxin), partial [Polaribacter sp.]
PNKEFFSQYINDSENLLQKVKRFRALSNTFVESVI